MNILGLNAYGHDAAAVLLRDGEALFAASQERFDRQRHSAAFPIDALRAALAHAGIGPGDVDHVAFPWDHGMARIRKALYVVRHLPRSRAFWREPPDDRLPDRRGYLRAMRGLGQELRRHGILAPLHHVDHHRAHAESARLVLPAGDALILTADGMGEWTTAALWQLRGDQLLRLSRATYPHSPGKAYSAVTRWLGFRAESDEGKTMGLAAYGCADSKGARFARGLLQPDARRLLRVSLDAFGFPHGESRLYGDAFLRELGPARSEPEPLREGDADVACGIQEAVQRFALAALQGGLQRTHAAQVGLAGGLFLNCALNGALARTLGVPVHPFPVAGDAGAAWGAAARVSQAMGKPPQPLRHLSLGTEIDDPAALLALRGHTHGPALAVTALAQELTRRLLQGQIVGVARGRAEFGPRALGQRSVLAHPRSIAVRDEVNRRKGREAWRPLAPIVSEDDPTWFCAQGPSPQLRSPWMILTYQATEHARAAVPGIVHADGTARVQTVGPHGDPLLRAVLAALRAAGQPDVLLNTSLNRRGEPIVDDAPQALIAAQAMHLDALILGNYVLPLSG